ncbi:MAG TPA: endonuclease/exonuclease/phosphatase family protein [Chitinophagaceae bacterium]|jgi:endonuclease/exonuclease/phosphatase family metal-dependent hydrolase|nr:endonuclease/exonuclease/phosphatase family protein [Chitinophagaceae bacterium]
MSKRFYYFIAAAFLYMPPLLSFSQEIKIMSYNIRLDMKSDGENQWDKRKEKVASLMNYYEADFIGGQEVQHHQLSYLLGHLVWYRAIGVGRDDGKQAGEYSCIFYKQDKYKVIQQSTFWLSPAPDSVSRGWDAAYNRVCTYGLFENSKTKKRCWVFNTHFDHVGKTARLESAKLIIKKIQEINTARLPVILMGDFNSKPGDEPVRYMLDNMINTRDISKLVHGNADTWNGFKFNEKPDGCIDYIFVSHYDKVTVSKFATLTDSYDMKYPSDHFPILATLMFDK